MDKLNQAKDEIAKELGYGNMETYLSENWTHENVLDKVAIRYNELMNEWVSVDDENIISNYWGNGIQNNFKSDFGFDAPHETKSRCSNPVFKNEYLHRIALMKDEHFGSIGDRDEGGVPGWRFKRICTGCGKEFLKNRKGFIVDVNHGKTYK